MSVFGTQYAEAARPLLLEQLGDAVTYTPKGGAGVALTAIADPVFTAKDARDGFGRGRRRFFTISTDAAAPEGGVAAPAESDELTIGGVVWIVEALELQSGSLARLATRFKGTALPMDFVTAFCRFTCTIQRRGAGVNAVNIPSGAWPNLATGVVCDFDPRSVIEVDRRLQFTVTNPIARFLNSQDVTAKDRVTAITRTADSRVMDAGPLGIVSLIEPGGEAQMIEVELERVT